MAYGVDAKNIIQGGATIFLGTTENTIIAFPATANNASAATAPAGFSEVGYTSEGLDISIEPDYLDVEVDQLLDSAALFKTMQKVSISTSFTEATLNNLAFVLGQKDSTISGSAPSAAGDTRNLTIQGGSLGSAPVERSFLAVGVAPRQAGSINAERVYYVPRVISVETVTTAVKRNEASTFPVTFRALPGTTVGEEYGKIVDRHYS